MEDNQTMNSVCVKNCYGKAVKIFMILALAALTVWLIGRIRHDIKDYKYLGRPVGYDVMTFDGEGKVSATPNIAALDLGIMTEKPDVASAQNENSTKMNDLLTKLKTIGINEADVQTTNYSIYPQYDYPNGKQQIRGYQVNQNAKIKIRDLKNISQALKIAGESGANQVSGISFTIDDPENLKAKAREQAVQKALTKAQAVSKQLGTKLGKVISYNEYTPGPTPPYVGYAKEMGMGGGSGDAPTIQPGSTEIIVTVNLTFETVR